MTGSRVWPGMRVEPLVFVTEYYKGPLMTSHPERKYKFDPCVLLNRLFTCFVPKITMRRISVRSITYLNIIHMSVIALLLLEELYAASVLRPQDMQPGPAIPPSSDSFYTPPTGFENENPGTILKVRNLGNNALSAFGFFPQNIQSVYQYLYRTNDGLGKPTATVTTLAIPFNADLSKLVSHQVAEDSATIDCAPSYALRQNTSVSDYLVQVEMLFIDTALYRGWPVCFSDYEGPDAMFAVGRMAGHAVLDGIRAVLSDGQTNGLQPKAKVQMWGYSGGALATGWAAQMHSTYAPEINIIGSAFGGTPVNLKYSITSVKGMAFASFATMAAHGLMNQYEHMANYVNLILRPSKRKEFYRLKNVCITPVIRQFGIEGLDYFLSVDDVSTEPVVKEILEINTLGGAPPKFPLFMYHSMTDHVIPFGPAEKLYTDWCQQGARIEFVLDRYETHARLEYLGTANAFLFMEKIFKGEQGPEKCSKKVTMSSALNLAALRVFGEAILDALSAIFGYPLGPKRQP